MAPCKPVDEREEKWRPENITKPLQTAIFAWAIKADDFVGWSARDEVPQIASRKLTASCIEMSNQAILGFLIFLIAKA